MNIFEVLIIVLMGFTVALLITASVGACVLSKKYKKFYEETKEGKSLRYALSVKTYLETKQGWLETQMQELRTRIDEMIYYFPENCAEKERLIKLKEQYKKYFEEYNKAKEEIADWQFQVDEIIAHLPKKYEGILAYYWEDSD